MLYSLISVPTLRLCALFSPICVPYPAPSIFLCVSHPSPICVLSSFLYAPYVWHILPLCVPYRPLCVSPRPLGVPYDRPYVFSTYVGSLLRYLCFLLYVCLPYPPPQYVPSFLDLYTPMFFIFFLCVPYPSPIFSLCVSYPHYMCAIFSPYEYPILPYMCVPFTSLCMLPLSPMCVLILV